MPFVILNGLRTVDVFKNIVTVCKRCAWAFEYFF
jgi:hypothetical protein